MRGLPTVCLVAALLVPATLGAEVTRVEIARRTDLGLSGYEKIVGTIYFAVNPKDPHNRVVVDLDKAPVNAAGKVEFSADLYIMRPLDASRANGVAFVDVVNRGRKTTLRFARVADADPDAEAAAASPCPTTPEPGAAGARPVPAADADLNLGDGLLTNDGFTLVWVGWQFDVRRRGNAMGVDLPRAKGVSTLVSAVFTPCDARPTQRVTDLAGYPVADPAAADTKLTVRDGAFGVPPRRLMSRRAAPAIWAITAS